MIAAPFPAHFALLFLALFITPAGLRASYKGAIVMDAASGEILQEDNADGISPPASVTKLMTFLLVHDALIAGRLQLTTLVTATATDQTMGGTQVFLAAGETFPVEELLNAVMIESATDAAHALTIPVAGSREAFVAQMNARAKSLGMKNTLFRTPHGLPTKNPADGDLTSPRDLALLARELVLHTDVLRYSSTRTRMFGEGIRAKPQPMKNHNKLLITVPGCDGLKTGYTKAAGFCLVATAQRGTKRVIVAVTGSPDSKTRDSEVARLLEEGLLKIPENSIFTGGPVTTVAPVPVVAVSPVTPNPAPPSSTPASPSAPAASPPTAEAPAIRFTPPKRSP